MGVFLGGQLPRGRGSGGPQGARALTGVLPFRPGTQPPPGMDPKAFGRESIAYRDACQGISHNGRRLETFQTADSKKIIKKIKMAVEYHTGNNGATWEGFFTRGRCLEKCKVEEKGGAIIYANGQQLQKQAQEENRKPMSRSGRDAGASVGQNQGNAGSLLCFSVFSPIRMCYYVLIVKHR